MALPVLDGNQTATTLSSVVTGGEHIVAHTVVSLGSTAISNITSAVSGSVVSVSNFPSTQTIAGTVTIGASSVTFNSNVAKRPDGSWQPLSVESGSNYVNARVYPSDITPFLATVTVGGFAGNVVTTGYTYNGTAISSVPVIVMENELGSIGSVDISSGSISVTNSVTIGSLPAISGTVTARLQDASGNNLTSTSIGGVQRLNVSLASAATPGGSLPSFVNVYGGTDGSAVRTISVDSTGRQNTNPQFPRVTLIDGSGTVATANTAITVFASSSTRSYLLVQVTTGSAFVNVGATATTVNGINLTAGQGYAWETTIPQGIVSLISTTTSSRYVAKEA